MGDERTAPGTETTHSSTADRTVPTAASSWRRNVEILDLVNRIRTTRARRGIAPAAGTGVPAHPPRPR